MTLTFGPIVVPRTLARARHALSVLLVGLSAGEVLPLIAATGGAGARARPSPDSRPPGRSRPPWS